MNTADVAASRDAYDRAEKCPACHRALYTAIVEPFDTYCPYPDCPSKTEKTEKAEKKEETDDDQG